MARDTARRDRVSDSEPGLIVRVRGVVQGVGFRPYIYRLALEHRLEGSVINTPEGVVIRVRGEPHALRAFVEELPRRRPPLARVTEMAVENGLVPVVRLPDRGERGGP
jgi:hydrogenase maturation protein HypF